MPAPHQAQPPQAPPAPYPGPYAPPYGQPLPPAKKSKAPLIAVVAVAAAIVLAVGGFFGWRALQTARFDAAYADGDYAAAAALGEGSARLQATRAQPWQYSVARALEDDGAGDEAIPLYEELGDYEDSLERAASLRYAAAWGALNDAQLDAAAQQLAQLGSYRDSAELLEKIAVYQAAEQTDDPIEQVTAFRALGDFLDSAARAGDAAERVYQKALVDYADGYLYLALESFDLIKGHSDADIYLEALTLWVDADLELATPEEVVAALAPYADAVDIGPLVMSDACLIAFLEGEWRSDDGGGRLTVTSDTFGFSAFRHTGQYNIGSAALSPITGSGTVFAFAYVGFNQVAVTVSDDGGTYTFARQE